MLSSQPTCLIVLSPPKSSTRSNFEAAMRGKEAPQPQLSCSGFVTLSKHTFHIRVCAFLVQPLPGWLQTTQIALAWLCLHYSQGHCIFVPLAAALWSASCSHRPGLERPRTVFSLPGNKWDCWSGWGVAWQGASLQRALRNVLFSGR